MKSNYPFVFAILAFGRSEDLRRVVTQISHFFPAARIIVLIDRYQGTDGIIFQANNETIEVGTKLLTSGNITHLEIPSKNLRTKEAWKTLMEVSFSFSESVVYVEDDLVLVRNPEKYLYWANEILLHSNHVAFATLFTSREHLSEGLDRGRVSHWPESWGVVINKDKYTLLQHAISDASSNGLLNLDFFERPKSSYLARLLKGRFREVWLYKFNKALTSDTAWDTELHLALWKLGLLCVVPDVSYLKDTGLHFTSVSKSKSPTAVQNCKSTSRRITPKLPPDLHLSYCKTCERISENKGYMFLPRAVKKILGLCSLGALDRPKIFLNRSI